MYQLLFAHTLYQAIFLPELGGRIYTKFGDVIDISDMLLRSKVPGLKGKIVYFLTPCKITEMGIDGRNFRVSSELVITNTLK